MSVSIKMNQKPTMAMGNFQIQGLDKSKQKAEPKKETVKTNAKTNTKNGDTVEISKSGREKARMLAEDERIKKLESKENSQEEAEKFIDNLIDTVKSGGKLTKEEERIYTEGLKSLSAKQYKEMKTRRLDNNDPAVLQFLKENYLERQRVFNGMLKDVEEQAAEDQQADAVMVAEFQQEKEEKERLIDALKEMGEEEDETEDESEEKKITEEESESYEIKIDDEEEEDESKEDQETDVSGIKNALNVLDVIEKNKAQIDEVGQHSLHEAKEEREYSKLLDRDYTRIMETLENEEVSAEEKLAAYDDYMSVSAEDGFMKEVSRIRKEFDRETELIARNEFQAHDDLWEVLKGKDDVKSKMGTEFIRAFLTDPKKINNLEE